MAKEKEKIGFNARAVREKRSDALQPAWLRKGNGEKKESLCAATRAGNYLHCVLQPPPDAETALRCAAIALYGKAPAHLLRPLFPGKWKGWGSHGQAEHQNSLHYAWRFPFLSPFLLLRWQKLQGIGRECICTCATWSELRVNGQAAVQIHKDKQRF